MTGHIKIGGSQREIVAPFVKIGDTGWHELVTGWQKENGVWAVVYSSGAVISFMEYPYPIPVMEGWKYSTDGKTWTIVVQTPLSKFLEIPASEIASDWDVSEMIAVGMGDSQGNVLIQGITGSTPEISTVKVYTSSDEVDISISDNDPNGHKAIFDWALTDETRVLELLDADGNTVVKVERFATNYDSASTPIVTNFYPGPFTGYVKVKGELSLSEYYNETGERVAESGLRMDGTALGASRSRLTSFVNGSKGYVCGGFGSSSTHYATVDVYDSSGNRTTGTSLSVARYDLTSFVNNSKGYVCGGFGNYSFLSTVDVYDSSGNRTTGTSLSVAREGLTSFVNNSKGYVCGGYNSGNTARSTVNVYDSSGNRTTGTSLSVARYNLASFVNNSKGYVCGGHYSDSSGSATEYSTVDVYDSSGNITTGTSLSVARYDLTSFVNNSKGYVCGGYNSGVKSTVDVYDSSGNRTTGNSMSVAREGLTSFVNNSKGYVCGGYYGSTQYSTVDIYYDTYEATYSANIPITEGSTYILNGESGTAEVSEVLTFNSKVSGTIKYKKGTIPFVTDWNLDNLTITASGGTLTFSGITGSTPKLSALIIAYTAMGEEQTYTITVSGNNPNLSSYIGESSSVYLSVVNGHATIRLMDASGNILATTSEYTIS